MEAIRMVGKYQLFLLLDPRFGDKSCWSIGDRLFAVHTWLAGRPDNLGTSGGYFYPDHYLRVVALFWRRIALFPPTYTPTIRSTRAADRFNNG